MEPFDYTSAFNGVVSPYQSVMQGVQGGAALQQMQAQQQQQQAAQTQAKQMRADLQALSANPTPDAIGQMMLKYPQLSESLKRGADVLAAPQKQALLDHAGQVYAAAVNGRPDIAGQLLTERATALRNSGDKQGAQAAEQMAQRMKDNPQGATLMAGMSLAAAIGPDKFTETFGKLGSERRADELAPTELATKKAKLAGVQADTTQKQLGVVGSTLGALQGKNAKPEQAIAALKSMAAKGIIGKDELSGYLASVPTDRKQLNDWLGSMKLAGMKPDDQMKYTTPDANTRANNATQLQVQDRIDARQESKGDTEPTLDPETLTTMAQQYLAGDKSVMQNLGRGAQGAANIVALRKAITTEAKARGMTGPQIAAKMADYAGLTAGMRTSGNISARIENAAAEASQLAPLALAASEKVVRSGFLPFGKAQVMFDTQTNDPALNEFATANMGLATAYAGAMARGNKPTVSDQEHARSLLSTAKNHDAYKAVVNQMLREIKAAQQAPRSVRDNLRDEIGGTHAAPELAPGWSVVEH